MIYTATGDVYQWNTDGSNAIVHDFGSGSSAAISASGRGRLRYNPSTGLFEFSGNGSAYASLVPASVAAAVPSSPPPGTGWTTAPSAASITSSAAGVTSHFAADSGPTTQYQYAYHSGGYTVSGSSFDVAFHVKMHTSNSGGVNTVDVVDTSAGGNVQRIGLAWQTNNTVGQVFLYYGANTTATSNGAPDAVVPLSGDFWVRLTGNGTTVKAYISMDGSPGSWNQACGTVPQATAFPAHGKPDGYGCSGVWTNTGSPAVLRTLVLSVGDTPT